MASWPMRTTQAWRPGSSAAAGKERTAQPAARKSAYERLLCNAIGGHWLVEIRYADGAGWRRFAPHAVFRSTSGGINVSGVDAGPRADAELAERAEILEIGRIMGLRLVEEQFEPDPQFDRASILHEGGVICSV